MDKPIKFQVLKELNGSKEFKIIKLKGNLISKVYTEISHILDLDTEFQINSFATPQESCDEVKEFIAVFISKEDMGDATY